VAVFDDDDQARRFETSRSARRRTEIRRARPTRPPGGRGDPRFESDRIGKPTEIGSCPMDDSSPALRIRPLVMAAEGTLMDPVGEVVSQLVDDPAVPVMRTVDEARRFIEREGYRVNTIFLHPPAHDEADIAPFIADVKNEFPWINFVHCTARRS
jgi:hypothetical protein